METQDRIRELTNAFLDTHEERIVEALSEDLRQSGSASLLPVHRTLLDLAKEHVREPSSSRLITGVRKTLNGADAGQIISGQMALWAISHRMLREAEGPHRHPQIIHVALALAGDAVDGLLGVLIDLDRSGDRPPAAAPMGWETLVDLGRTYREFQTLNRITRDMLRVRDPEQMFQVFEEGVLNAFHIRSLIVAAVHHEEGVVEVIYAHSPNPVTRAPMGLAQRPLSSRPPL